MLNWIKPELEVLDVRMTLKGISGGSGSGGGGGKHKCNKGHSHHGPGNCPDPTPTDPVYPTES
ncbi:paeninodin family lasso peptide [Bacillus sp. AGMB 02131]|uniref:Paeninodin family lasso peptide n=1 Tax=Peribacillus faecalis TaxID=2772559 RepID=A0A927HAP5_9BACI|nr:paeninodin family lasso peptide [Peribacillus faecalis]MBD3107661.1 paeninodin family lasso peptide [Peribacillus faecalis]